MKTIVKYKPNQVIVGQGLPVVVTGWTESKWVRKQLADDEFSLIGQLFSGTRGINILIRNLLLNPHLNVICLLKQTKLDDNAGSIECLCDFFHEGAYWGHNKTGQACWVINSEKEGYIDGEIPFKDLQEIRAKYSVRLFFTVADMVKWIQDHKHLFSETQGEIKEYPMTVTESKTLPSPLINPRVTGKTVAETWVKLLYQIRTGGVIRPTGYDGQWQELLNLTAVVTDEPFEGYFPTDYDLPVDHTFMSDYYPQILSDSPYKEGLKYTYGQRLRSWFGKDQIEQVIDKLIAEIDSASAVMSLWDAGSGDQDKEGIARYGRKEGDSDHDHSGSPCLNHIWCRVVDNRLILTALFRSNDMFSAWCANAMGLRRLQYHIRDQIAIKTNADIDLQMGELVTISQSAHIYDDCWENVDLLIEKQYKRLYKEEITRFDDPVGNFIISAQKDGLIVEQTTKGSGEVVREYCGNNPLALLRDICCANPNIKPHHAGYLGIELEKAFKQRLTYQQDK